MDANGDRHGDFEGLMRAFWTICRGWESRQSGYCPFSPLHARMTAMTCRTTTVSIPVMGLWVTLSSSREDANNVDCACCLIWWSITLPMNIPGSSAARSDPKVEISRLVRVWSRRETEKCSLRHCVSRLYKNRRGTMTRLPRHITFIVFTIFQPGSQYL